MKRLQRRIRDSDKSTSEMSVNASASSSRTFDRRTFTECSNRMKRLVPTLSRRSDNLPVQCEKLDEDFNQREISILHEKAEMDNHVADIVLKTPVKCFLTRKESSSEVQASSNLNNSVSAKDISLQRDNRPPSTEVKRLVSTTLPRSILTTDFTSGKPGPSSATLPSSFSALRDKSSRRSWLKPLKILVTFMSNIGDNIDITSYPTP